MSAIRTKVFLGTVAAGLLTSTAVLVAQPAPSPQHAQTTLTDATGATVGTVLFTPKDGAVLVRVSARGSAIAAGFHGFHVHDVDSCTVGDAATPFTAAGPHWNPDGKGHRDHMGDMPPLFAPAGTGVEARFVTDRFSVESLVAAKVAVIVHVGPDNLANIATRYQSSTAGAAAGPDTATLATGDAGNRAACGVVSATG